MKNQMSRREFTQTATLATAALSAADAIGARAAEWEVKVGLYSITYL